LSLVVFAEDQGSAMPHTPSAKKSLRKNAIRRLQNRAAKKSIKIQVKKLTEPADDATPDKLQTELKVAIRKLDKAAAKRVIHPNTAARKKSQLTRLVNRTAQPK
jgi:small subunit ribosomal protein S20